ncbi:hypothetical protein [Colwellia piezophila]|uniref:hypothetical protein n=1 Tax=Colwellia piezophila TaxID=211668 RepID=UPI0012FC1AF7|nr:hypothetical protein [Colwellia piezophila]
MATLILDIKTANDQSSFSSIDKALSKSNISMADLSLSNCSCCDKYRSDERSLRTIAKDAASDADNMIFNWPTNP